MIYVTADSQAKDPFPSMDATILERNFKARPNLNLGIKNAKNSSFFQGKHRRYDVIYKQVKYVYLEITESRKPYGL